MEPFQERLLAEQLELQGRVTKLQGFIDTGNFNALPERERHDLTMQYSYMSGYLYILDSRVARLC